METLSWLCLFLPLAGVVVLALAGNRIGREPASWLATAIAFASFICGAAVFFSILGEGESARSHVYTLYTWAGANNIQVLRVPLSIQVDQLSVVEMLVVSGVGALIVMYSIGYMHGDPKQRRFFAYMNLFLFSMLLLVMAGNFVLLLAGWGLVGLSSYLLIGFWHEQEAPVAAAKKAFVMNAIGDVGIAIAIFFMVRDIGTTDYHEVFTRAHDVWPKGSSDANWVALLLLAGRRRQVGPDPAPHLASRRHGGPHPGQRPDPRGHHGDGRRLPDRALPRAVCQRAQRAHAGGGDRRGHAADGGRDRARADRHQTHHRLLDHEPDRLHVRGRGRGRRLGRHVPPAHATRSSRRCCSSAPASSSTRSPTSRTCAGWAASPR